MANEADAEGLTPEKALEKRSEKTAASEEDEKIIEEVEDALKGSLLGKLRSTDEDTKADAEKEKSKVEDKADEAKEEIEDNKDDAPEDAEPPPTLDEPSDKPEVKDHGDEEDDDGGEREEAEEGKGEDEKDASPDEKEDKKEEGEPGGAEGGGLLAQIAASDGEVDALLDDYEPKSTAPTDTISRIGQMAEIANGFRGQLDDYVASGDGVVSSAIESGVNRIGAEKQVNAIFHDNPYKDVEGGLGVLVKGLHLVKSIAQIVGKICSTLGIVLTVIGLLGMIFAPIGTAAMGYGKMLNTIGVIANGLAALMGTYLLATNGIVLAKQIQEGGSAEEKAATADLMVTEASETSGSLMGAAMAYGPKFMKGFLAKSNGVVAALFKKTKAKVGGFISAKVQGTKNWGKKMLRKLGFDRPGNWAGAKAKGAGKWVGGTRPAQKLKGAAAKLKKAESGKVGRWLDKSGTKAGNWGHKFDPGNAAERMGGKAAGFKQKAASPRAQQYFADAKAQEAKNVNRMAALAGDDAQHKAEMAYYRAEVMDGGPAAGATGQAQLPSAARQEAVSEYKDKVAEEAYKEQREELLRSMYRPEDAAGMTRTQLNVVAGGDSVEAFNKWLKGKATGKAKSQVEDLTGIDPDLVADPTEPLREHDADAITAGHTSVGRQSQAELLRHRSAEVREEVKASESASSEPAEDEGDAEGALPYWPSLIGDSGEFQEASDDLSDMRKIAEEFRDAQSSAKEKAYDVLALYGDYDEYAKKRAELAKEHKAKTAETAAETEESSEAADEGEKLGAKGASEQNEAEGQGDPPNPDIPEPEGKGFFGRILAKFQKWAKKQAGKLFGAIQGVIANTILRALGGVSMEQLQDYSAALRRRQTSAGEVAEAGEEQSELAEKSNVELSETAHEESQKAVEDIAECDRNIEEADQFLETISDLEEQLAREQEIADDFIETVKAEVEAERAEAEAEEDGEVLAGGDAPMSMAPDAMMSTPEDGPMSTPEAEPEGAELDGDAPMSIPPDALMSMPEDMPAQEQDAGDDFSDADALIDTEAAEVKRQAEESLRALEQDRDRHEQRVAASVSAGSAVVEEFRPHAQAIMAEMDAVAATAVTPDTIESLMDRIIDAQAELAEHVQAACEALEKAFEEAYAQANEPMTPAPRPAADAGAADRDDSALDVPMTPAGGAMDAPAEASEPQEALS